MIRLSVTLIIAILFFAQYHTVAIAESSQPVNAFSMALKKQDEDDLRIFVPVVRKVYIPPTPILNSIDNGDLDNFYTLAWNVADSPEQSSLPVQFTVEESRSSDFSNATIYQVDAREWSAQSGGVPGTYYYRIKAQVGSQQSEWSNIESVTIYPLFVGLQVRWDGVGYLRGYRNIDIGWYEEWLADTIIEGDTIRILFYGWYDPNPLEFSDYGGRLFYSATKGTYRSSNARGDPSWKWGYPNLLPYDLVIGNNQELLIGNQEFEVRGPLTGYTTYGQSIQYWELVNKDEILFWENGDWQQYVHEGDAILRYHAGNTRFLLYSSVLRHDYYDGDETGDTVHYINQLSSSNALANGGMLVQQAGTLADQGGADTGLDRSTPAQQSEHGGNTVFGYDAR